MNTAKPLDDGIVAIPPSTTDPYTPEPTQFQPVRVRLLRLDQTVIDLDETRAVLAMPLFWYGGALYIRRGADGIHHLYREVPDVPRLDATPTPGETKAYQTGLATALGIAVGAKAELETNAKRTRTAGATLDAMVLAPLRALIKG